ncbi:hypothetical protein K439DRAFT_1639297 [Ramaria rubella]|nr:hypothetical protein K439DRAFT_1639297 [Ramaria rubella]
MKISQLPPPSQARYSKSRLFWWWLVQLRRGFGFCRSPTGINAFSRMSRQRLAKVCQLSPFLEYNLHTTSSLVLQEHGLGYLDGEIFARSADLPLQQAFMVAVAVTPGVRGCDAS